MLLDRYRAIRCASGFLGQAWPERRAVGARLPTGAGPPRGPPAAAHGEAPPRTWPARHKRNASPCVRYDAGTYSGRRASGPGRLPRGPKGTHGCASSSSISPSGKARSREGVASRAVADVPATPESCWPGVGSRLVPAPASQLAPASGSGAPTKLAQYAPGFLRARGERPAAWSLPGAGAHRREARARPCGAMLVRASSEAAPAQMPRPSRLPPPPLVQARPTSPRQGMCLGAGGGTFEDWTWDSDACSSGRGPAVPGALPSGGETRAVAGVGRAGSRNALSQQQIPRSLPP